MTEWEKEFTVSVRGSLQLAPLGARHETTYYTSKGPAQWTIDSNGNLHIDYNSVEGAEIPLATHIAGTWYAVSQCEVEPEDTADDNDEVVLDD